MAQVEEIKARRYKFLHDLYEVSGGDQFKWAATEGLRVQLGLSPSEADTIMQYLANEGLAKRQTRVCISITHAGIKEVEAALSHPDEPTDHFPAVNILNIGTVTGGQIQQGTHHSSQTGTFNIGENAADLKALLAQLRSGLPQIQGLSEEDRAEATDYVQRVEKDMSRKEPKSGLIKAALESVAGILGKATEDVTAAALMALLKAYLAAHGVPL